MSTWSYNARGVRTVKAKASVFFGKTFGRTLMVLAYLIIAVAFVLIFLRQPHALLVLGVGIVMLLPALWERGDLDHLLSHPFEDTTQLDEILPREILIFWKPDQDVTEFWKHLSSIWQVRFIIRRGGLDPLEVARAATSSAIDYDAIWAEACQIARDCGEIRLNPAMIMAAWIQQNSEISKLAVSAKLKDSDLKEIVSWLCRLDAFEHQERPIYGGIARDWAAGFTPLLAKFGQNLSRQIEAAGQQFSIQERTNQLDSLVTALSSGNSSVALIGETGIGKTALLYGLADRVLRGERSGKLAHHQIISLNASLLVSGQQQTGDLERLVLSILSEAMHAGNIIVALDEAQLFFGQGTGAVNLSQILLPILQGRALELVLTLTPGDWQSLKATNTALASLVTPINLQEPDEAEVIRLMADRALVLEHGRFITTYQALREAYRLSGRYFQEEAYPGRALKLLESALAQPEGDLVTEVSVQRAIEGQLGVKVEKSNAQEADILLNFESKIHERMINQSRAVSVVAAALRRARAGVANPKRPFGSFLFLGPTGVGKTELARSVAALYFGDENRIVRLDMTEYQQPSDADRILAGAAENNGGFLTQIRANPFSVVLLDEIEKAHPNVLNLLLQLLDEGNLTDTSGKKASFKDAIVIATSNAGADEIRERIQRGEELEQFESTFTDNLISSGSFKPELINRFDEVVLFRPLNEAELAQVVHLLIAEVNRTLKNQNISVSVSDEAIAKLVQTGYDPRLGARPMRRMVTRVVEDAVASKILKGEAQAGDTITLELQDITPTSTATTNAKPKDGVIYERSRDE